MCFQQDKRDRLTQMHNKIRLISHKTDSPLKANLNIKPASEEHFAHCYWTQSGQCWCFISHSLSPTRFYAGIADLLGTACFPFQQLVEESGKLCNAELTSLYFLMKNNPLC